MRYLSMQSFSRALLAAAASTGALCAQFPGDVFFREPAVTAANGEVATLDLQTYAGSTPLGAAQLRVSFDPLEAEFVGFDRPDAGPLADRGAAGGEPGEVTVLVYNPSSLTQPIGTVDLGSLQLRPLVAVGEVVDVQITVVRLLDATTQPYAQTNGAAGTIAVTAAVTATAALLPEGAAPAQLQWPEITPEWRQRLRAMGRPGQRLQLWLPLWRDGWPRAVACEVAIPPLLSRVPEATGGR